MTQKRFLLLVIYAVATALVLGFGWLWYVMLFPRGRIIFQETGKFYGVPVLVTIKPNGENGRVLLNNYQWKPLTNFSVSSDGKLVAFASYNDPRLAIENRTTNIYLVHEEIGAIGKSFYGAPVLDYKKVPKVFCEGIEKQSIVFNNINWSPEGDRLVFTCPFVNSVGVRDQLVCVTDMESNINC